MDLFLEHLIVFVKRVAWFNQELRAFNHFVLLLFNGRLPLHRAEGVSNLLQGKHSRLVPGRTLEVLLVTDVFNLKLVLEPLELPNKIEVLIAHQRILSLPLHHITFLLPLILNLLDPREQRSTLANYLLLPLDRCLLFNLNLAIKIVNPLFYFVF